MLSRSLSGSGLRALSAEAPTRIYVMLFDTRDCGCQDKARIGNLIKVLGFATFCHGQLCRQ